MYNPYFTFDVSFVSTYLFVYPIQLKRIRLTHDFRQNLINNNYDKYDELQIAISMTFHVKL